MLVVGRILNKYVPVLLQLVFQPHYARVFASTYLLAPTCAVLHHVCTCSQRLGIVSI